ncbi:response regulator [Brucepastera parasyntrophica]|nr:response regulator [Brucepastera parasyntrophica]
MVDDEQINVEFFDLMLSKLGFVVKKASNGLEALEKLKEFNPDLIMLDNIMPGMSGWEVTRKIKNEAEFEKWRDVPIVMFSAMDDVKDKIEGFELGVDDYITKPFNFSEVLARLRSVLRTHDLIDQLKKRESRIALYEQLTVKLLEYADLASNQLVALNGAEILAENMELRKSMDTCKAEYTSLQKKVAELQEEAQKLKNNEIGVDFLVSEMRKQYSE